MPNGSRQQQQGVTAHFMLHWGVPKEIHVRSQGAMTIGVLEFAPRLPRQTFRFATNGMSGYRQIRRTHPFRTELYVCTRHSADWVIELLVAVAQYPILQETALIEYDTVPVEGPIDGDRPAFEGLLIAPPGPEEAETLGAIGGLTPEPLLVHQVVGISRPELDFAIEQGGRKLWEELLLLGTPLLLDEARPDAIQS